MPSSTITERDLRLDAALVASGKLPDDIGIDEFNSILTSIETLIEGAGDIRFAYGTNYEKELRERYRHASQVIRVRYGSPIEVVLTISAAIAGTLATIALVLERYSLARRNLAESDKLKAETRKIEVETERLVHEDADTRGNPRSPLEGWTPTARRQIIAADIQGSEIDIVLTILRQDFHELDTDLDPETLKLYGLSPDDFMPLNRQKDLAGAVVKLGVYGVEIRIEQI